MAGEAIASLGTMNGVVRGSAAVETEESGRSFWVTALIGAAVMAAVDEIIFHQLLGWHHFYDRATPAVGLFSDGILHAAELIALVGGFFLFADLRSRHALSRRAAWGGFFVGAGGFQLFDGVVDHKVLRLHQIRYGVPDILPYDVAWNAVGALLLVVGMVILMRTPSKAVPPNPRTPS